MAQFRNMKDIADEVLQKSGEPTNGNSAYEDLVITYLNKVQQAIIGGGNIFSINVDEPWTWARAKNPITIDLLPAYTFGSISIVGGESIILFSDAPPISLTGWYIQCRYQRTTYKITSHLAGATAASIDSPFIGDSSTYAFRAFKLEYEIYPRYIHIDSGSDRLDFSETIITPPVTPGDPPTIVVTTFLATLTHGTYTPTQLIDHVIDRMNTLGSATYEGTYDPVTRFFEIESDLTGDSYFSMLGATGANKNRSALPSLGFDYLDFTEEMIYTSTFMRGGISRLIEPFRIYGMARYQDSFIKSTDPVGLEEDFPLAEARQSSPVRFAKVFEDNSGTIWVRFNSYPGKAIKVVIDWIPIPLDLQDNEASIPVIPRKDIDALIHGACMFIAFDKEDSKWGEFLQLTKAQLEAMSKKNRSELFRTGENFGNILPRQDQVRFLKNLDYGYMASGGEGPGGGGGGIAPSPVMIHAQINYPSLSAGALTHSVVARLMPAGKSLHSLIVKHNTAFEGTGITEVYVSVGIAGEPDKFIANFLVSQPVNNAALDSAIVLYYPITSKEIIVTATAVGNNLNALTQGSLDIYLQEQVVDAN